mgnify:CR=1 FL=1
MIKYFTDELDGTENVIIEHEDGSTTSMLKSTYEAQLAAQKELKP